MRLARLLDVLDGTHAERAAGRDRVDSGFRRGSDVVKAIALGATAVLVGRPTLYGAAAGGADGVRRCLQLLVDEMHVTLAHLGVASIAEVDRHCVDLDGVR